MAKSCMIVLIGYSGLPVTLEEDFDKLRDVPLPDCRVADYEGDFTQLDRLGPRRNDL